MENITFTKFEEKLIGRTLLYFIDMMNEISPINYSQKLVSVAFTCIFSTAIYKLKNDYNTSEFSEHEKQIILEPFEKFTTIYGSSLNVAISLYKNMVIDPVYKIISSTIDLNNLRYICNTTIPEIVLY